MRAWWLLVILVGAEACGGSRKAALGEACSQGRDCASGTCVQQAGRAGRCSTACGDEQECGPGNSCRPVTVNGSLQLGCLPSESGGGPLFSACSGARDCATGICHHFQCVEACTACGPGAACQPVSLSVDGQSLAARVCQWRRSFDGVDLGPVTVSSGESADLTFDLPADVASFTITLQDDDDLRVAVTRLTTPNGTLLANTADTLTDLNPGTQAMGASSLLVPSTDSPTAAPQTGTYALRVGTFDPAVFDMLTPMPGTLEHVWVTWERKGTEGGVLDLRIHVAPGTGLTSQNAALDPYASDMLTRLNAYLLRFRAQVGTVEWADLPVADDVVADGVHARKLCTERSDPGPHGASVNVFLVQDQSFAAGLAGGIPGPPGVYGSPASGIVVKRLSTGDHEGILLAHELGHFLGLHHTTELSGGITDPILDTASCPRGTDINSCPDKNNLMFPSFFLREDLDITAGQKFVVGGSPHLFEMEVPACSVAGGALDVTDALFAASSTVGRPAAMQGSCGGQGGSERVLLVRVQAPLTTLSVEVAAESAVTVYARGSSCTSPTELGCTQGTAATLTLHSVAAGPLLVVVDGDSPFTARVTQTP